MFVFLIPYTASVYNGLSRLFAMAFNMTSDTSYMLIIVAMAVLTAIYVILGGYAATAINDFVQGIVMLVGIAHIVDLHVVGTGTALRSAVVCFYLSNEGVSLLENAAHLGLPVPEKMKEILEQLHDRAEKEEN